ncbi:hypothetical protein BLOT_008820 [Blomia tropicalis]|nr:hypothetical protein BLOT_008820 [Blomia tropicalis]
MDERQCKRGEIAVKYFCDLNYVEKNSNILVVNTQEDIIGKLLNDNDYTNVDILYCVSEQRKQWITKASNVKSSEAVKITTIENDEQGYPFKKQQYEVVIMAIDPTIGKNILPSFEIIIQWVKSGGLICWSMDQLNVSDIDGKFDRSIMDLCDKCKWLSVLGYPRSLTDYIEPGINGMFHAMQVV